MICGGRNFFFYKETIQFQVRKYLLTDFHCVVCQESWFCYFISLCCLSKVMVLLLHCGVFQKSWFCYCISLQALRKRAFCFLFKSMKKLKIYLHQFRQLNDILGINCGKINHYTFEHKVCFQFQNSQIICTLSCECN